MFKKKLSPGKHESADEIQVNMDNNEIRIPEEVSSKDNF